jgi:membrane-associated phospholipid phosphatase
MSDFLKRIYLNKPLYKALKNSDLLITLIFLPACAALLALSLLASWQRAVCTLLSLAVPFVLVSLFRRVVNLKRPYEVYGFYEESPRDKRRASFPSRHTLSATLISVLFFSYSLPVGIVLSALTLTLAALRVLLGYHFVRDVVAAIIIGAVGAVLGMIILL